MLSFIRKKYFVIVLLGFIIPLLSLFQNCGNKEFSAKTDTTLESVADVTDETEVDPDTPLQTTILKLNRDVQEELPTHILLILDDSTSNAANIPSMLNGVKDIIAKFSGKQFKLSVHTTGNSPLSGVNYSIGKYVSSEKSENIDVDMMKTTYTKSYVSISPLAEFDSSLSSNSSEFFKKVEDYFKSIQSSTKLVSYSTPNYHCQLLSYFKALSKKEDVDKSKYIVLVSSDENTSFQSTSCLESDITIQTKKFNGLYKTTTAVPQRNYVEVPLERKDTMEGGIIVWTKITQKFYDITCTGDVQSRVSSHLAKNANLRLPSQGLSCTNKIQSATPEKKEKIYDLVSTAKDVVPMFTGSNYAEQVSTMQKKFNKGLLFYGTFTIRTLAEKVNADQEVGEDHAKYARLYASEKNIGEYSVVQSNYDDFVDEVFVFDLITTNNFFSLADHRLDRVSVQSIRLIKYNGVTVNRSLPFTQTSNAITVTDSSINLNLGCELEIVYKQL